MIRRRRGIAIGDPEDAKRIEFATGDTIRIGVPSPDGSGSGSASASASGSASSDPADVEVVSGSVVRIRFDDEDEPGGGGPVSLAVREMIEGWRAGDCPAAEAMLERHPALRDDDGAVVRLIDEEIRLRRSYGQEVSTAEFVRRFPRWEARVAELFELATPFPGSASPPPSRLPAAGEALGEFHLLSILGRGAKGSVFLAVQPGLANRPLVLKVTPREGQEHLSLARLQHAHIVPLYWVQDLPDRDLRVLCMPYLGGTTLARLLAMVGEVPWERRTGRDLLDALDRVRAEAAIPLPGLGPARQVLAQATYVQAICWIGACLADALHFAHQRDLLHLDLKPSNILLAADGTPMLLDFHLSRAPILPDGPALRRLGGTPAYMSPEQWSALARLRGGDALSLAVDGRSDIYSLGRLLYEALGGEMPAGCWLPIHRELAWPRHVPPGLADIVGHCLESDPDDRYHDAASLARDLRRHLADLPLRGVANRSVVERWRKWRRRRPHALGRVAMASLALAAVLFAGLVVGNDARERLRRAEAALADGRKLLAERQYPAAAQSLGRGLALVDPPTMRELARFLPRLGALRETLGAELAVARRSRTAEELHDLAERVRLLSGTDPHLAAAGPSLALERRLRTTWEDRDRLLGRLRDLSPEDTRRLRADLLELAIAGARLRVRTSSDRDRPTRRHEALRVIAEAEALFGPSPALERERQSYAEALGLARLARASAGRRARIVPATAWDHDALGRSLLDAGELEAAAREFDRAADLRPEDLWAQFDRGVCAYRLRRFGAAAAAFDVCVALSPKTAECYYNRARARAALGQVEASLHDYDQALRLDPHLAPSALNRGVLLFREGRHAEAIADFRRALDLGARPSTVHYNLALAHLAQGDPAAARADLDQALRLEPDDRDLLNLDRRLRGEPPAR